MASLKKSSTHKDRRDDPTERVPESLLSDLFPYSDKKDFKGHGFFMKIVGTLKNHPDVPVKKHEIHMEDSEYILEYVSLTTSGNNLVEDRQKDLVYEDHFNQSIMDMFGKQKFSYKRLIEVCSNYENKSSLQEHIQSSEKNWHYFKNKMDEDSARAAALAIAFYTGSQATGINRTASVIARQSNGEVFQAIKDGDLKDSGIIIYHLVRGLAHVPYFWGVTARGVQLTDAELDSYKSGILVTWLQFTSSIKGDEPPECFRTNHNTRFIIYSLAGRSIQRFSMFPDEDEVLFLPHSTFLVIDHRKHQNIHYIHVRQVELGLCQYSVLWVDDHIFDEDWENKEHMQHASTRSLNDNVHFIPKSTTDHALSFLRSPFGQRLKNRSTFRIVTDMRRDNEEEPRYAGIRLITQLRELGFHNRCLIFTGYEEKAREKVREKLTDHEYRNVSVTEKSDKLHEFVGFNDD